MKVGTFWLLVTLEDSDVEKHEFSSMLKIYCFSATYSTPPSSVTKQILNVHILWIFSSWGISVADLLSFLHASGITKGYKEINQEKCMFSG